MRYTVYELVSGKPIHHGTNDAEQAYAIRDEWQSDAVASGMKLTQVRYGVRG